MPFVIGGTYIFSPNLQLILGVSVDVERKYPVIPAAGVRWKIGPQWLLDAVLPTPRLQYEMTRNVSLYAGATITEATFRADDEFGTRMEFRASTTQSSRTARFELAPVLIGKFRRL